MAGDPPDFTPMIGRGAEESAEQLVQHFRLKGKNPGPRCLVAIFGELWVGLQETIPRFHKFVDDLMTVP
jgi:hypothetical protein